METNPPDASAATRIHLSANDQLPSLTSLRGVAALWVVVYHYSVQCFPALDVDVTHVFHKGYLAVDMFFMLSGFVLTHVYHRQFLNDVGGNYRGFVVARFARIYPLHLLILLLFVLTAIAANWKGAAPVASLDHVPLQGPESVLAFFANIFLVQGLSASKLSWNYPSWSISVEFMAYLLFPFVLPLIWRANAIAKLMLAGLFVGLLGLLAYIAQGDFDQWDGPIVLLRCFPEFMLGTLLYCAFRSAPKGIGIERDTTIFGVLLVTLALLHFGAPDLLITLLFALVILASVLNAGRFAKWANVPALVWLGDISYSIYLIHSFVQFLATKLLGRFGLHDLTTLSSYKSLALAAPMLVLCLVAAHLSYFCFEVRSRRYVRDLLGSQPLPATGLWFWLKAESQKHASTLGRAGGGEPAPVRSVARVQHRRN
jgi:peptidoglycan/LPS O-acetylase OafA/YrhL